MSNSFVVTIDGPAASGKSSVSRELARKLGWNWVSTGAFYRGLAYVADREQVDFSSEQDLVALIHGDLWSVQMGEEKTHVLYRGQDVTDEIHMERVGNVASRISHFPRLREELLNPQRACASPRKGLVAEGRDCGTVVFPQASMKFYLTARSEDRAARRALEQSKSLDDTIREQQKRDEQDSQRATAPLAVPEGSEVVDTSQMGLDEVVTFVESRVREKLGL